MDVNALIVILSQIMEPGEELTNLEADQRFEELINALGVPPQIRVDALSYWMKASDHNTPVKLPPVTVDELVAVYYVAAMIQGAIRQ